MNKKGFVLIETIVVILVLCVLLIMLYGGYMNVITSVQKKSHYDNTEYIYKTTLVKDYLLEINTNIETETIITICQGKDRCLERFTDNYMKELINQMHINSIYITNWNPASIGKNNFSSLEATTQNYLNKLDATIETILTDFVAGDKAKAKAAINYIAKQKYKTAVDILANFV